MIFGNIEYGKYPPIGIEFTVITSTNQILLDIVLRQKQSTTGLNPGHETGVDFGQPSQLQIALGRAEKRQRHKEK
jgi:hypothetical protein